MVFHVHCMYLKWKKPLKDDGDFRFRPGDQVAHAHQHSCHHQSLACHRPTPAAAPSQREATE